MRCLRFLTFSSTVDQSMVSQSGSGPSAPMSWGTLSCTVVSFLYHVFSLRTRWKSALFRVGQILNPSPPRYRRHSLFFSSILSLLNVPPPLRFASSLSREFMRLPVVPSVEIRSGRMLPMLRRVAFCRPTVHSSLGPLAYLLVRVSSAFLHAYIPDEALEAIHLRSSF